MIRVTVEIVPFGIEGEKHTIGTAEITNLRTGNWETGNYEAHLVERMEDEPITVPVTGFKRLESNAWELLYQVLNQVYGRPKKKKKSGLLIDTLLKVISSEQWISPFGEKGEYSERSL